MRRPSAPAAAVFNLALVVLALAGCMTAPAPKPVVLVVTRLARVAPRPDWFQRQMILARDARRDHLPHSDTAGARQAYFKIALAACTHTSETGLTRYRPRCAALMRASVATAPAPSDATQCEEGADDPDKVVACND